MNQIIKSKKIVALITLISFTLVCGILVYKSRYQKETSPYSQQEMKEAIIYFNKSQEYEKALVLAKEYVALYPEDAEGWTHRGYAYFGLGDCVEATSDFYHGSVQGNVLAEQLLNVVLNDYKCKN